MPRFKEIWFDFDGTLTVASDRFNIEHDKLRYTLYAKFIGKPLSDNVVSVYENLYAKQRTNSAVFKSLGLGDGYWMEQFESANLGQYYEVREDVPRVLKVLAGRAKIGLFTNNKKSVVVKTLKHIKVPIELFSNMVLGDQLKDRKPMSEGFEKMLSLADCNPSELIYIGDRYGADIEPIQKLGGVGGFVWGVEPRADYSFPEFTDLLDINK